VPTVGSHLFSFRSDNMTDIKLPLQEEAVGTFIPKILVVTIMETGSAGRHEKRGGRSLKSFCRVPV